MKRTTSLASIVFLFVASIVSPLRAQIFPGLGKARGLPKIPIVQDNLPALANAAYGEVMLSGNEALLEPGWLVGSLRDIATGQVLKWNNYLLPDAKPNVRLLTENIFEGFVNSSAVAKTEWLSALKMQAQDSAVAEVSVTRVSVTSIAPKQIDRDRLLREIVQRVPPEQQARYGVIIAYIDIAITATRFQHYEVEADVAGYGGRIGGDWYYKDKQKLTEHRLLAISAPLQFAVTSLTAPAGKATQETSCCQLVRDAIQRGEIGAAKPDLLSVASYAPDACPIAGGYRTEQMKYSRKVAIDFPDSEVIGALLKPDSNAAQKRKMNAAANIIDSTPSDPFASPGFPSEHSATARKLPIGEAPPINSYQAPPDKPKPHLPNEPVGDKR